MDSEDWRCNRFRLLNLDAKGDTSTGAPVGNPITVGNQPVAVAMSHNGVKAYVTNTSDNTVSVIKIFPAQ
ncbi:MAG: hypothetical protein WAK31_09555 [Chthoniobacterales bacterium]